MELHILVIFVEYEDSLAVVCSDNTVYMVPGPITKWSVYSKSKYYLNHFLVILDNKIDILFQ